MVDVTQSFWFAPATITKVVVLLLGTFIVYLAYRGYRRNASKPLLYVALGFALVTAGTLIEGIMLVLLKIEILESIASGTVIIVLGFIAIIYSIYSSK